MGGLFFAVIVIYIIIAIVKKMSEESYNNSDNSNSKPKGPNWHSGQDTDNYTEYSENNRVIYYDAENDDQKDADTYDNGTYGSDAHSNNAYDSSTHDNKYNGDMYNGNDYSIPDSSAGSSTGENSNINYGGSVKDNTSAEDRKADEPRQTAAKHESADTYADFSAYTDAKTASTGAIGDVRTETDLYRSYQAYPEKQAGLNPEQDAFTFSDVVVDARVDVDAVMQDVDMDVIKVDKPQTDKQTEK